MSPDYDGFGRWLMAQGYLQPTRKKALRDLRALVGRNPTALNPTSAQRARDYRWAFDTYQWYAREEDAPALPAAWAPGLFDEARPKGRRRKRVGKDPVLALPRDEWRAMVRDLGPNKPAKGAVDAVLLILAHQGLRVGDVLRLPRPALEEALARPDKLVTARLKGGKPWLVRLGPGEPWWSQLAAWMRAKGAPNVAAIVTPSGNDDATADGAAYKAVSRRLRALGEAHGIEAKVHQIRHTVAVELMELGVPKVEVQQVLGHEDLKTTGIYTADGQATVTAGYLDRLRAHREEQT